MARRQGWQRGLGNALSMATNMAAAIALGYFGGRYLDQRLGTEPWLTMLLFLLGVGTGLRIVYQQAFSKGNQKRESVQESENNIKVRPSQEIIDSLQAARQSLKDIEAEIKSIHPKDSETAEDLKSQATNEKEDGCG